MGAGVSLVAAAGLQGCATGNTRVTKPQIQGLDEESSGKTAEIKWEPFSDRKVRVGIAGEGVCCFGSAFSYQTHPNVEVVAATDLDRKKCELLQKRTGAKKTYASCEEMIRAASADKLEAVYIATDAPSHARLAIMALEHGLNVASAVPAVFGREQLDLVPRIVEAARKSGRIYMMNETSAFRSECVAMRNLFKAGCFGNHLYSEGEYFHYFGRNGIPSYKNWRVGLPPQYYPTHSNGFYTCVTHGRFTEVTCVGFKGELPDFMPENNVYKNPYDSEIALYKTSDGGTSRMAVVWGAPGYGAEVGRFHGTKGSYMLSRKVPYQGLEKEKAVQTQSLKMPLPPGVKAGGHGGSHAYLTDDFIRGILLKDHKVCVDIETALNTTVSGIYAHISAMKDGETLKIPSVI